MTEKEIDRALRKIERNKHFTYGQLTAYCNRFDPSMAGLRKYFKRNYVVKDAMGRSVPSPDDLLSLNDEGHNRLAAKRGERSDRRWTRGPEAIALIIAFVSLIVSIIALLKGR
jgi:hypothetical protein